MVIFNLGGPDGPGAVRPFLVNLFMDPAILRFPPPLRWLMAQLIVTRRLAQSQKIYVAGSTPDIRVPMREIACSPTRTETGFESNPSVTVYDTSGVYQDPDVAIDLLEGLPPLRAPWIEARGDTEQLAGPTSRASDRPCRSV